MSRISYVSYTYIKFCSKKKKQKQKQFQTHRQFNQLLQEINLTFEWVAIFPFISSSFICAVLDAVLLLLLEESRHKNSKKRNQATNLRCGHSTESCT